MITKELIQNRIAALNDELGALKSAHEAMVRKHQADEQVFQQSIVNSQNRYQQLTGAIAQFTDLLNGANGAEKPKEGETK